MAGCLHPPEPSLGAWLKAALLCLEAFHIHVPVSCRVHQPILLPPHLWVPFPGPFLYLEPRAELLSWEGLQSGLLMTRLGARSGAPICNPWLSQEDHTFEPGQSNLVTLCQHKKYKRLGI